jgi:hypothetical protein
MRILRDSEFAELRDVAGSPAPSFFSLPQWYALLARHGLEKGWQARAYADDAGRAALVCAVPADGQAREVRGCINPYTCEYDWLGGSPDAVRATAAAMARADKQTQSILLPGLDPKAESFAATLAGLRDAGFTAKSYFAWGTWYEPVQGVDFQAYLSARPSVLQNTWRRKSAALQKAHRIALETSSDVETFIRAYDDVYARSWKEPEPFVEFMPALLRVTAALGALRHGVLSADGKPIAAQFWIVWQGQAIIFKLAYDKDWNKFSPGTVLTMHMAKEVLEKDRVRELNFGRGDDDYKKLWMSERRERWGIEAVNPRSAAGFARALKISAARVRDRLRGNPKNLGPQT